MGEVTSLDKSVFFWTQKGLDYGYGVGFRDENTSNLENSPPIKAGAKFDTCDRGNAIGIIAIHAGDWLISGSEMFTGYITRRMWGNPNRIDRGETKRPIRGRKPVK